MSDAGTLALAFVDEHPEEAAQELDLLNPENVTAFLTDLPEPSAAKVLEEMLPWPAAQCLENFDPEKAASLIDKIIHHRGLALLRLVSDQRVRQILNNLPKSSRVAFRKQLLYPENTVGAWMDPYVPTVLEHVSVREALDHIREHGRTNAHHLYAVKKNGALKGIVSIPNLVGSTDSDQVDKLLVTNIEPLADQATLPFVMKSPQWNRFHFLPVADQKNRLIGVLSYSSMQERLSQKKSGDRASGQILPLLSNLTAAYLSALIFLVKLVAQLPFARDSVMNQEKTNAR